MSLIVKLEYEIRTRDGELLESSDERGPLELEAGRRRLLPALEQVIAGLRVGDEVKGELPAARAFGDESALPTMEIAREEFGADRTLEQGQVYAARRAGSGEPVRFRVISVGEKVGVRLLHPLADKDLRYRFKLLDARDSTRPPPVPARAIGIDSAAIKLVEDPA